MTINLNLNYNPSQSLIFFPEKETKFTIVPKGRRFGATKGGANAFIEWAVDGITPMLWVDTINSNIDRYVERYFEPELKKNRIPYNYQQQKKILTIMNSVIDLRSAEHPENIEGFGYRKIFMNEAGIILTDNYLYTNAILPMLMDFPDSQLYAVGTPKGITKKDGKEHLFYTLAKRNDGQIYRTLTFSTYDNSFLNNEDIEATEKEITEMQKEMVAQEIYGKFIDISQGSNPFAFHFDSTIHTGEVELMNAQLLLSIDFNLNPFSIIAGHLWRDEKGFHCHLVDEAEIFKGSIPAMIDTIKERWGKYLPTLYLTGDNMGTHGDLSQRDNASYYEQLRRGLNLRQSQIKVLANPTHSNSRADVNYFLKHFPDFKVSTKNKRTIFDLTNVECDAFGSIIKRDRKDLAQRGDFLDCVRYFVNTFLNDWIKKHQKGIYTPKNYVPLQNENIGLESFKKYLP